MTARNFVRAILRLLKQRKFDAVKIAPSNEPCMQQILVQYKNTVFTAKIYYGYYAVNATRVAMSIGSIESSAWFAGEQRTEPEAQHIAWQIARFVCNPWPELVLLKKSRAYRKHIKAYIKHSFDQVNNIEEFDELLVEVAKASRCSGSLLALARVAARRLRIKGTYSKIERLKKSIRAAIALGD